MSNTDGLSFTLDVVDAGPHAGLAVVEFTLDERLSMPFRLDLEFACEDPDLAASAFLEREVVLSVWQEGAVQRRVHGVVMEFSRGDVGLRRTLYRLKVRPPLWRLSLRHNSRIFQQQSPVVILRTLCEERGMTHVDFALTREHSPREYCVQYRETDLAFLQRLAAEEGIFYFHEYFEYEEERDERPSLGLGDASGPERDEMRSGNRIRRGSRLVFTDDPRRLPGLGERYYCNRSTGMSPSRQINELWLSSKVRPASVALKDYTFKRPDYEPVHQQQADESCLQGQRQDYEWFDYPGRYKQDASGRSFSCFRLESLRRDAKTAHAQSDLPELRPGVRFRLSGHQAESLNDNWQVVSVSHHGTQHQALGEDAGEAMTRYDNSFEVMPANVAWRDVPQEKPRVGGPQVAIVVGPEGEEIFCDEYGRVKVWFPWDRYHGRDEHASCWIRVSQTSAGGGFGHIAIPHVGDEVIVEHLEGDPDQPIIMGRTYHASNRPAYELPANKAKTVLRSTSHKGVGYSELVFEEEAGKEEMIINSQRDVSLIAPNASYRLVGSRDKDAAEKQAAAMLNLFGLG